MIRTPTVLVLGAGASAPYGFPSAPELKTVICDAFQENSTACHYLSQNAGIHLNEFFRFREELRKSGQVSVDAFLERRPEWISIGKLAIAYCLMPYEDEEKLFACDLRRGGNWYEYLFGKLSAPFKNFGKNELAIITFNYDRSLEHYLLTTLQNAYGKDRSECVELMAQIPIVHVYGQLSITPYPDRERSSNSYLPRRDPFTAVEGAAAGIKILHEANSPLDAAHQLLSKAQRICFLGFNYHPVNVSRLEIDSRNAGSKAIFGTARGLIGKELEDAANRVHDALGSRMTLSPADNLQTLREHLVLG